MNDDNLTAGLEDYLETIYITSIQQGSIKGAELARLLDISRASVSEALSKLTSKGLIEYESYGSIILTKKGIAQAKRVYAKHNILKIFFEKILDIEAKKASENACKIEHIVSQEILDKIEKLTLYYVENPNLLEKIKGVYQNKV